MTHIRGTGFKDLGYQRITRARQSRKKSRRERARLAKKKLKRKVRTRPLIIPRSQRIRHLRGRTADLYLPENLNLLDHYEETVLFFAELRAEFIVERSEIIKLHLDAVTILTPEAALVLIAELFRLMAYSPKTKLFCFGHCRSREAEDILHGVGFNDYFSKSFNREKKRKSLARQNRTYIRHRKGFKTSGKITADLVEEFAKRLPMSSTRKEMLRVSLGECMVNAGEHAYLPLDATPRKWVEGIWWMLGYTDEKEIYFAFLDQGVGIPRSLRAGEIDDDLLIGLSDEELVVKAFTTPLSRTGESHRGRGLPTLRRYAQQANSGYLAIQTGNVRCDFVSGGGTSTKTVGTPFKGTLLIWHIKNVSLNG